MTTAPPASHADELRELAAWLDDLARALTSYSHATPRVMRDWMRAQVARCEGRAFLTRQAIGEAPGQVAAGGCEFCPAGGGGCSVCLGRS